MAFYKITGLSCHNIFLALVLSTKESIEKSCFRLRILKKEVRYGKLNCKGMGIVNHLRA